MTPQERRELLKRICDDLIAEHRAALAELEPVSEAYSRASSRVQRLSDQRQRVADALEWFHPDTDPVVTPPTIEGTANVGMAEADLDDVLHGR